jgi:hypothetical protein
LRTIIICRLSNPDTTVVQQGTQLYFEFIGGRQYQARSVRVGKQRFHPATAAAPLPVFAASGRSGHRHGRPQTGSATST